MFSQTCQYALRAMVHLAENPEVRLPAQRIAEAGFMEPLATRGIVGQVTTASIVYDAETTSGGSGGPVIDLNGRVVAVNMAILPEFGGSNLGVPAADALALIRLARGD